MGNPQSVEHNTTKLQALLVLIKSCGSRIENTSFDLQQAYAIGDSLSKDSNLLQLSTLTAQTVLSAVCDDNSKATHMCAVAQNNILFVAQQRDDWEASCLNMGVELANAEERYNNTCAVHDKECADLNAKVVGDRVYNEARISKLIEERDTAQQNTNRTLHEINNQQANHIRKQNTMISELNLKVSNLEVRVGPAGALTYSTLANIRSNQATAIIGYCKEIVELKQSVEDRRSARDAAWEQRDRARCERDELKATVENLNEAVQVANNEVRECRNDDKAQRIRDLESALNNRNNIIKSHDKQQPQLLISEQRKEIGELRARVDSKKIHIDVKNQQLREANARTDIQAALYVSARETIASKHLNCDLKNSQAVYWRKRSGEFESSFLAARADLERTCRVAQEQIDGLNQTNRQYQNTVRYLNWKLQGFMTAPYGGGHKILVTDDMLEALTHAAIHGDGIYIDLTHEQGDVQREG